MCTYPLIVIIEDSGSFKSELAPQKFEYFGACEIHEGVDSLMDRKTAGLVGY